MDSEEFAEPLGTAHVSETESDDTDFEDALEELVVASNIKDETSPYEADNPDEYSSTLRERQIAEEIVNEAIESALSRVGIFDNDLSNLNASPSSTGELYEDAPANDESKQAIKYDKNGSVQVENELEGHAENENVAGDNEQDEDENLSDEKEDERFVVDEELLKEREANLTDEEKQELKDEAQAMKAEGNDLFKENNYTAALIAYTNALRVCPLSCAKERSIMYSNRAACKLHLDQKESAIEDCTKALELNPNYMKCLLRRAELYEKADKLDEALGDYQKALEKDPGLHAAREACMRLPDQIKERNEKLKEEMIGKLKDLGNLVLRPFGLSTDNFKLNQDPQTGGYSVSFQQNPAQS